MSSGAPVIALGQNVHITDEKVKRKPRYDETFFGFRNSENRKGGPAATQSVLLSLGGDSWNQRTALVWAHRIPVSIH